MCGCNKKRTYAGVTSNVPRPETHPTSSSQTAQQSMNNAIQNAQKKN